jgi:glutaminyl-tRNA synthetase
MRDAPTPPPTARVPRDDERTVPPNFVTDIVDADVRSGRVPDVVTRFPPEPNGYLHIGHAKAIALDFGIARDYGGRVHLRMDDTNPTTEDPAYVAAIEEDIRWLGFEWDELRYASDYFEELYAMAERLIEAGDAYVDLRDEATVRATRGTVTEPGVASPDRDRSPAENLELFRRMRAGGFADGAAVLRAKIDLASPNMVLRDPVLYRVKHAHHYRTGDAWCIYPLYDFAHPLSDAIEGVTHSLCTLEFENNRAIYDWLVDRLFPPPRPRQYEFARLSLDYTITSKRRLLALVREAHVTGWDDPRMPTLAALRRRGVPAEAVRELVARVGVTRAASRTDPSLLDTCVRDVLNPLAPRAMAVLDPVPLWLDDPDGELTGIDGLEAASFPDDVAAEGSRLVPLGRRLWIERDDVAVDPPPGYKRLAPGRAVRLRHAPVVRCERVEVDDDGRVVGVHARVVAGSLGQNPEGEKVWAAIHWVDADTALAAEFRLYDRLFDRPEPGPDGGDFRDDLDPRSLEVRQGYVEPSVAGDPADQRYQFERLGYFWRDPVEGRGDRLVWNRIVTLKDTWRAAGGAADDGPRTPGAEAAAPTPEAVEAGREPDPFDALEPDARARAESWADEGVTRVDAALVAADPALTALFEGARAAGAAPRAAAPWVAQEARGVLRAQGALPATLDGAAIAELLRLIDDGTLHAGTAREAFRAVAAGEGPPADVVARRGLAVVEDDFAIAEAVHAALAAHPDEVAAYRGGKVGLFGFFVGQVMRATGGRADPKRVQSALRTTLDATD